MTDTTTTSAAWMARAACAGHAAALDTIDRKKAPAVIRQYCARCPVRPQCLAWVTSETGYVGIAAGQIWLHERTYGPARAGKKKQQQTQRQETPA